MAVPRGRKGPVQEEVATFVDEPYHAGTTLVRGLDLPKRAFFGLMSGADRGTIDAMTALKKRTLV